MAFSLNVLRALFGLDGQSTAQPAAAPAPKAADPAGWADGPPDFSAAPAPDAQASAQTAAPAPAPPQASALPPGLIDPSTLPQRPTWAKRSAVGDTLDNLFLGGAIQKARHSQFDEQEKNYQDALQLAQMKAQQALLAAMDPSARAAAILNGGEAGKAMAQNLAPQMIASGAAVQYGQGGPTTANPKFTSANGVTTNDSTGDIVNRYALPQIVTPGAHIGAFTPGVVPPTSAAGLPQLPAASPPMASPADVLGAAPGARITSGYRDPAHNADVGGVVNSWHTAGTPDAPGAIDVAPGPGQTVAGVAASIARRLPQLRTLNEGNHVHVQPNQRNTGVPAPQGGGSGSIIDDPGAGSPLWTPPKWNPEAGRFEQTNTATNEVRDAGAGAFNAPDLRKGVMEHPDYKEAIAATTAVKAMVGNATKMTGPAAYSMLDTFARAINPGAVARPTVIQTIEANLGLPAQLVGSLDSKFGKGNLPPETRQQILDAVAKFAQAHWDNANRLNQNNVEIAGRHGLNPADVTAPLEARPGNVHLALPSKDQLTKGDIYAGPNGGMFLYTGTGFAPYGR